MSITQLRVMPFQFIDDHTVYCVRVKVNNFRFYDIKRPFLDYVQFSQGLQQHLPKNNNSIPKLKKDNISKLLKSHTQKHMDRQEELGHFIKTLLTHVPPEISRSEFFMKFFSDYSVSSNNNIKTTKNALKRVFSTRRPVISTTINTSTESLLSRSTTTSCMVSPPPNPQKQSTITSGSTSSSSSSSMRSSYSFLCSDIEDDITEGGGELNMIKLKIIYNAQDIVIIRVLRSILWDELNIRVRHKFALLNINLPEKMVLQVAACRNSTSSSVSNATETSSLISTQDDLNSAMHMGWSSLDKVTLRVTL